MAATPNWALWGVSHWPRQDNNSKCNHAWNWNEPVQISIHSQQIQIHSRDKSRRSPVTAPTAEDFTVSLLGKEGGTKRQNKKRMMLQRPNPSQVEHWRAKYSETMGSKHLLRGIQKVEGSRRSRSPKQGKGELAPIHGVSTGCGRHCWLGLHGYTLLPLALAPKNP